MANEYSLFNLKIIFGKLLFRIISSVIEPANGLKLSGGLKNKPLARVSRPSAPMRS
jgi:hypothetical protein